MNIFIQIRQDILNTTNILYPNFVQREEINIESPKDPLNGDLSTNIAMIISSKTKVNPRECALKFKEELLKLLYIAHIEVAGPGFINFTIKANYWQNCIKDILTDTHYFNQHNIGNGEKIIIEFVSANPTGPMHVGHARCAVYGDVLAKILTKCGFDVVKEYYINDAGSQVQNLTETVILRYKEYLTKQKIEIPVGLYPGDYLIEVGKKLAQIHGDKLLELSKEQLNKIVKDFAVEEMMQLIKDDLTELGVKHDVFTSELALHQNNNVDNIINELTNNGKIYKGLIPPPKGKKDKDWQEREQLLFKATDYGDDQDRPLQKSNLEWTYLASDLALVRDKMKRGFRNLIYIFGADHSGYIKRIKAIVNALSNNTVKCDVKICQMVNFVEDGKPIKMSKRLGSYTTVHDVIEAVGKDIVRFIMLTRRNDMPLDFDLKIVKQQSKENPVFYVQYANVRAISILSNAKESLQIAYEQFINHQFDLSLLDSEEEIQLIKLLASWSKVLENSATYFEPHRLSFYLLDVAAKFHSLWNLGKSGNDYRFINENDLALTSSRLALASAVQKIISNGLEIMGICALTKM